MTTSTSSLLDVYTAILARVDKRDIQLQSNALLSEELLHVQARLADVEAAMLQLDEVLGAIAQLHETSAAQSTAADPSTSYATTPSLVELIDSAAQLQGRLARALSGLKEQTSVERELESVETEPSAAAAFPIVLNSDKPAVPVRFVIDGASVSSEQTSRVSERQHSPSSIESGSVENVVTSAGEREAISGYAAAAAPQATPALSSEPLHPSTVRRLTNLATSFADRAADVTRNPGSAQLQSALSAIFQGLKSLEALFPAATVLPNQAHSLLDEMEKGLSAVLTACCSMQPYPRRVDRLQMAISSLHVKCPGFRGWFGSAVAKLQELQDTDPHAVSESSGPVNKTRPMAIDKCLQRVRALANAPHSFSIERFKKTLLEVNGILGSSSKGLSEMPDEREQELEDLQSTMRIVISVATLHRDKLANKNNIKLVDDLLMKMFTAGGLNEQVGVRLTESRELLTQEFVIQLTQLQKTNARGKPRAQAKWLPGDREKLWSAIHDLRNWKTKGRFDTLEFHEVLQVVARVVKRDCTVGATQSDPCVAECLAELKAHTDWLAGKSRVKIEARIELLNALLRAMEAHAVE